MDFAFTEEQKMISDTAEAFLKASSSSQAIREAMATPLGYETAQWQSLCQDMYWQAMHIPEEYGGLGLGYVELVAVLEQMGRYLYCSPFLASVGMAANALLIAGSEQQKSQYLAKIVEGSVATLAYGDGRRGWHADSISASYQQRGEQFEISGNYRHVLNGDDAEFFVVAARRDGSRGEQGVSLFVIPRDAAGLQTALLPTVDQTRRLATVTLDKVCVDSSALMSEAAEAWPLLEKIIALGTIAVAAEQAGGMQQLTASTVEYTQSRSQFGRQISSFQAIKHKAADMMMRDESARSAIYYAACIADEALANGPLADELSEAASIAKAWCSDSYFKNAGESLQMHGGVGFTWEYDVHLYFKRAKGSEHFLGNGDYHRERLATKLLDAVEGVA
ncbi:MAG: acyl-CoA dehydrogenase family protein [Spongiibacteraceae bacterium]